MQATRAGTGSPLILIHGLGNTPGAWDTILPALQRSREVILVTLPGHGGMPAEPDSGTFDGLMRSLEAFVLAEGLSGSAMAGSSMGARMVLEMARRGHAGPTVALDPGGFWKGWETTMFRTSLKASLALLRGLGPALKPVARTAPGRSVLLAQLSAHPWKLEGGLVARELSALATTPTAGALIDDLAKGPVQSGPAAPDAGPVTIGWGRHDRLCVRAQAKRAKRAFPDATFHWFEHSGHYPMWDQPREAAELILAAT